MTYPRGEVVVPGVDGMYHCTSRCVRRAFLCGFDKLTRKNYDHRKALIENRLKFLVSVFAIEVLAFAIMSNHLHLLISTCMAALNALSDREIAERWLMLYPKRKNGFGKPSEEDIALLAGIQKPDQEAADRLGSAVVHEVFE